MADGTTHLILNAFSFFCIELLSFFHICYLQKQKTCDILSFRVLTVALWLEATVGGSVTATLFFCAVLPATHPATTHKRNALVEMTGAFFVARR